MNNEQESERMLEVLNNPYLRTVGDIVYELANAGIGDKKQAVKEFMDKMLKICERTTETISDYISIEEQAHELFTELYGGENQ